MARRLPSLLSLHSFEAAARYLSFTRAARELNVSQGVVSHHVKRLEQDLGVRLFRRLTRRVALTEAGEALQPAVSEAFSRIGAAVDRIRDRADDGPLTVNVGPFFAARWLSPRLSRFWQRHPRTALRLRHAIAPAADGFVDGLVDLAVAFGQEGWPPGVEAEPLLRVHMIPVMSPNPGAGGSRPRTLSDLAGQILVHEWHRRGQWAEWLATMGEPGLVPAGELITDDPNVAVQAAVDGQGVALAAAELVAGDLEAGRLVAPFAKHAATRETYYLVYPKGALGNPQVRRFRDWLMEEVGDDVKMAPG